MNPSDAVGTENAEIACHRELGSAAESHAVQRRHCRQRKIPDLVDGTTGFIEKRPGFLCRTHNCKFLEVATGRKRIRALARNDSCLDDKIGMRPECVADFAQSRPAERIAGVRTIDAHPEHVITDVDEQVLVASHAVAMPSLCKRRWASNSRCTCRSSCGSIRWLGPATARPSSSLLTLTGTAMAVTSATFSPRVMK